MRKKVLFIAILLTCLLADSTYNYVYTNASSAPVGRTGSPWDGGQTCAATGCHSGPATAKTGWITSNVPPTGYVPGTVYTITATITQTGITKFGFQISPQYASGNLMGSLIAGTGTQLVGSGEYITHTSAGTSGSSPKSWTFDWTAPTSGTGTVTFYGAFNAANGDGSNTGDVIYTSTLDIAEQTMGITSTAVNNSILLYPTPTYNDLNVHYTIEREVALVKIELYNILGEKVESLLSGIKAPGAYAHKFNLDKYHVGVYFLNIEIDGDRTIKKVIVQ